MIDAYAITNFSRTEHELEEYLMFCIAVANKTAPVIAAKIDLLLSGKDRDEGPFDYMERLVREDRLLSVLRSAKTGKYRDLTRAYPQIVRDFRGRLDTATVAELETIHGVGAKTARYFVVHSRPDQDDLAIIDTHVMKYLRHIGHEVPDEVPTGKKYRRLELLMVDAVRRSGMTTAEFDLAVWSHYASKGETPLPGERRMAA